MTGPPRRILGLSVNANAARPKVPVRDVNIVDRDINLDPGGADVRRSALLKPDHESVRATHPDVSRVAQRDVEADDVSVERHRRVKINDVHKNVVEPGAKRGRLPIVRLCGTRRQGWVVLSGGHRHSVDNGMILPRWRARSAYHGDVPSSTSRPLARFRSRRPLISLLTVITLTTTACTALPVRGPSPPARGGTLDPGQSSAPLDRENVEVVNAGIGAYELTVLPIAVIKNLSTAESALRITITWKVLTSNGAHVADAAATIAILGPGQTTVVGARIAGNDVGGSSTATTDVASWTKAISASISASPGVFTCGRCGPSAGYGSVVSTLTTDSGNPPSPLDVAVACTGANGAIVGGGSKKQAWTTGGTSQPVTLPVLVKGTPTACLVGATPAS